MKPACQNHPDRNASAFGLCSACYMRQRRAKKREAELGAAAPKPPAGHSVRRLLAVWSRDLEAKLEARIDATGGDDACHLWLGSRNNGGYGVISLGGYFVLAHRMMHALHNGDADAQVVMHVCDNPICVNPRHLRSGTYQENTDDMKRKGRGRVGPADHLRDRLHHPAAKRVQTPLGTFPSAALAAEAAGIHPRSVSTYCRSANPLHAGWRYLD